MYSFLNTSTGNTKFNDYLSVCDLINKYNLKNIYESPQLSGIVLEFTSSDVLLACESGSRKEVDTELQIKVFFLLYILGCQRPFINLNKIKVTKESGLNYSVKVILSSREELNNFLSIMFVENWNLLLADDFHLMKNFSPKFNQHIKSNRKFILNTKIPSSTFFELEAFLNKRTFGLNSKNLNLLVSFIFEKNKVQNAKKMSLDLIKNLPFFWTANTK